MKELDKTIALLQALGLFDPNDRKHRRALRQANAWIKAEEEREGREENDRHGSLLDDIAGSPG